MIRRLARNLLLLLAVFGLMPGANEVTEQIVELLDHGHLAHSVPGALHGVSVEHGCTPTEHRCGCHEGQSVTLRGGSSSGPAWGDTLLWVTSLRSRTVSAPVPISRTPRPGSLLYAPPTPPPNA